MKRTLATVFLCLQLATPAGADYDEGKAAYERKDYATALREWRPLAEKDDATVQYNLGAMYENGRGVPQDYVQAIRKVGGVNFLRVCVVDNVRQMMFLRRQN